MTEQREQEQHMQLLYSTTLNTWTWQYCFVLKTKTKPTQSLLIQQEKLSQHKTEERRNNLKPPQEGQQMITQSLCLVLMDLHTIQVPFS